MGRLYKYSLISIFKEKALVFWMLIFPMLLATIEALTIGRAYEAEKFQPAKAAIVCDDDNSELKAVLEELEKEEDPLITILDLTKEEATVALDKEEIDGIYYIDSDIHLAVSNNGIGETILSCILEQYEQKAALVMKVIEKDPAKIPEIMKMQDESFTYLVKDNEKEMNSYLQYFYAVFVMTCMYGSFLGMDRVEKMQANLTSLGQRREVSPTHKLKQIISEYFAMMTVEAIISVIMLIYFEVILKIHLGVNLVVVMPVLLLGNSVGITMGIAIGSLSKISDKVRTGICICVSMIVSFFSGLMFDGIRAEVDKICPLINKINPGALIVDSFYALSIYDTYDRYLANLLSLAIISIVMCIIGFLLMRRNSYEHL